jgi:hypothetical protein
MRICISNYKELSLKKMYTPKTSPAVMLRMSNDFLWLIFIENVCYRCNKTCSQTEAQHCFDDWMLDPLASIPSPS